MGLAVLLHGIFGTIYIFDRNIKFSKKFAIIWVDGDLFRIGFLPFVIDLQFSYFFMILVTTWLSLFKLLGWTNLELLDEISLT